jgi:hypothetical protein
MTETRDPLTFKQLAGNEAGNAPAPEISDEQAAEAFRQRIKQLPPEVGAVLIGAGIMGMILPGPIGTPLLLVGGLVLIPRVFGRIEGWFQQRFPKPHRVGIDSVDRFIDDLERRFPPKGEES